ncbi:MAG: TonB-dependent receptor plug domain-containing protein, partial [Pseudomonadota bacterium]
MKVVRSFFIMLTLGLTAASPVLAQSLDEIVVTAQRRAQSLQEVPVAVSAFSEEDLARIGATETLDIAKVVPNFVAHNNTGLGTANTYSLRGLNNTESIATFDPPVGTYVDDYFIQRQNANNYALFDIDRVEVLRGPQGTLFGRNTTGGAVRVILAEPAEEFGGYFEAGVGRFDRYHLRGGLDIPVSENWKTKVSAYWINDDGFVENLTTGQDGINFEDNIGVRAHSLATLSEKVSWDASVTYINSEHANLFNRADEDGDRFTRTGLLRGFAPLNGSLTGRKQDFGLGNKTE